MNPSYILHRGGKTIDIQKESTFITAILPSQKILQQVRLATDVQDVKQVFGNIYKIKTSQGAADEVSDELRTDFKTDGVFHHSYHPVGDEITRYYITDKIIVCFRPNTSNSAIEQLLGKMGLEYLREFPGHPNTFLLKVTSSSGKNPIKLSNDLMADKLVEWAEPNLINRFIHSFTPTDELYAKQWHLKSKNDIEMVAGADVSAPEAWDISMGSHSVVVAVIDDGFDLLHPDLSGPGKIVYPKDFIDGDNQPFPEADNDDYHGTPCAGVAIGNHNGKGILGIAPDCAFLPIRFPLSADDNTLWNIFDYASQYADVISCSWGPPPVYDPMSTMMKKKFTEITTKGGKSGKGALICFAAGNYNAPLMDYNNKSFQWRHPSYGLMENKSMIVNGYCVHEDVVAVAASTSQNRKSLYSNWGKEITVCAPSDNWNPLDHFAKVPGRGIWTTDNESQGMGFSYNNIYTGDFGGTSSATPLVAGIAALVRSANPDLTAREVKAILEKATDKIIDEEADSILQNKKGTYDENGHSEWFGYGKINAFKALQLAKPNATPTPPQEETPPTPVVEEKPQQVEGLFIAAALVNPKGPESGNETVTLFNQSSEAIALNGWHLMDNKGRKQKLEELTIEANNFLTIGLQSKGVQLSNSGGSIYLVNELGLEIHKVEYDKKEVAKDGWSVWFGQ